MPVCGKSLFGGDSNYIKVGNGQIVAIEGSNTTETLLLSDLRMPYKQLVKARIVLKEGQVNYLLNHLGLGDNATFLALKATYNQKSVVEADNYVNWSFYDDMTRVNSFAQMMILTGNSTNRIKQIFLTNPNTKYPVVIDVIVAVMDDVYSFFNDINQTGTSFTNLSYSSIKNHIIGQSLVIVDDNDLPLIYLTISTFISIEKSGNIIIIDDESMGRIFLQFSSESDAYQVISLFNYLMENEYVDIEALGLDNNSPIVKFFERVGESGDWISMNGLTGSSFDTTMGLTFSTSIDYVTPLNSGSLFGLLVDNINDNRDGLILSISDYMKIKSPSGAYVTTISATGSYVAEISVSDLANNRTNAIVQLEIK